MKNNINITNSNYNAYKQKSVASVPLTNSSNIVCHRFYGHEALTPRTIDTEKYST